ncbi:YybS family protein [Mangrovibacillus cuniculi]|uniref:YybS family protein n=1 Tax=Mangrovibacillus cuniculi TaxID=2593652 RepID=A0A7S8CDC3_9BACI|nr:YybS family protein [Mangrovibacillus cuniculi]QPC47911.1 YybS family protein [Mangrovibacillus cuniculi]
MENNQLWRTGLLLGALYIAGITFTAFVPYLALVTMFLLPVPVMFFVYKHERKPILVYILLTSLLSIVIGSIGVIPIVAITMIAGYIIGTSLKQKWPYLTTFMAVSMSFLVSFVLSYALISVVANINVFQELITAVEQSVEDSMATFENLDEETRQGLEEQVEQIPQVIQTLIPSALALTSAVAGFLMILIAFVFGKRKGLPVPKAPSLASISLPRSIIWYYLIVLLLLLFGPVESGTYLDTALANLQFMLRVLLFVQGITFLFFLAQWKKWPKALPILISFFTVIFFPLVQIVVFFGIMDLGLQLRQRLTAQKK